jgi:hypothetical protein
VGVALEVGPAGNLAALKEAILTWRAVASCVLIRLPGESIPSLENIIAAVKEVRGKEGKSGMTSDTAILYAN